MTRFLISALAALFIFGCASAPKDPQMTVADITAKGAKRLTGPEVRSLMSGAKMEGNAWSSGTSFTSTMNPNGTFDGVTVNGRKFDGTWSVNDSSGRPAPISATLRRAVHLARTPTASTAPTTSPTQANLVAGS